MIDRTISPAIQRIEELQIPSLDPADFLHAAPIFAIGDDSEDLVKIEVVFPAGTGEELKPLLATATSAMLLEGTEEYTSPQISELKDFFGATLRTGVSKDHAVLSLLCLKGKLEEIFPVFVSILQCPTFPEKEFGAYKTRAKASLDLNLNKVEIQSRLLFSKLFFGESKYAENYSSNHFDELTITNLKEFHRSNYSMEDAKIFISGARISDAISLLKRYISPAKSTFFSKGDNIYDPVSKIEFKPKVGALQSAIRLGISSINRNSADYPAFSLTSTLLGGYFGSRLMQNIREDKGYTYGIGSSINHLLDMSYLIISTEVGVAHTDATLKEIKIELNKLRSILVDQEELELAQNYMAGTLLKNADGTFAQASLVKMMVLHSLDKDFFKNYLTKIYATKPEQILESARTYLNFDKFTGAVVGKPIDEQ